ncbi:MAG: TetR/AcrR family transcriptional regulator [Myxococcota bacterium]
MKLLAPQMRERRERILESARRIIGEGGYASLTMRDLAAAADVTVPTIYNLVGGKDQVLIAAVADQTERFVAGIERLEAPAPGSRVCAVVEAAVREMLGAPLYYRALLPILFSQPRDHAARAKVERALTGPLYRGIEELLDAGELSEWVRPQVLRDRLLSHLSFTALRWAAGDLDDSGFRAVALSDACWMLLGVTRGGTRAALERQAAALERRLPVGDERRQAGGG